MSGPDDDLACQDVVELITAYLDGAVPEEVRQRIDRHLPDCPGCRAALDQWREVITLSGHLSRREVDTLDERTRAELLRLFRDEQQAGPTGSD